MESFIWLIVCLGLLYLFLEVVGDYWLRRDR